MFVVPSTRLEGLTGQKKHFTGGVTNLTGASVTLTSQRAEFLFFTYYHTLSENFLALKNDTGNTG